MNGPTYPAGIMNDTPTSSSILAALHAPFGSGANSMDGGVNGSTNPNSFGDFGVSMPFVDANQAGNGGSGPGDQGMNGVEGMFGDFGVGPSPFDVQSFTPSDLGMSGDGGAHQNHGSSPAQHGSPSEQQVKDEGAP